MTGRHHAYREYEHRDVDAAAIHPTITRHILHCVDTGESTTFDAERDLRLTDCDLVTENEYAKVREYARFASNKGNGKHFFS